MSIIGVIIGICILGIGIWTAQNHKITVSTNSEVEEEILPTLSPTDTLTPSTNPSLSPIPSKPPTTPPTKTPTTIPTTGSSTSFEISHFQYPGTSITSSSTNRLELATTDLPTSVTDWYKKTINQTGMNTKSFVSTNTNGHVLNKLVAAGNGKEVRVDITKEPSDASTKIIVELK